MQLLLQAETLTAQSDQQLANQPPAGIHAHFQSHSRKLRLSPIGDYQRHDAIFDDLLHYKWDSANNQLVDLLRCDYCFRGRDIGGDRYGI